MLLNYNSYAKKPPKNSESKKQSFRICLRVIICLKLMKESIKKEQISSCLVYNIASLGNMAGKAEPFS